jgi:hypothetical protein
MLLNFRRRPVGIVKGEIFGQVLGARLRDSNSVQF